MEANDTKEKWNHYQHRRPSNSRSKAYNHSDDYQINNNDGVADDQEDDYDHEDEDEDDYDEDESFLTIPFFPCSFLGDGSIIPAPGGSYFDTDDRRRC